MRVYVGSDHAGFELKGELAAALREREYEVVDVGPPSYDPEDDYPAYCLATATRVVADPGSLGLVIGGSGNGEQIAANKVEGARAALAWSEETARLARLHNDANLAGIGARMHASADAINIVLAFVTTQFSAEPRHARRIAQVADYERSGVVPALPEGPAGGGT